MPKIDEGKYPGLTKRLRALHVGQSLRLDGAVNRDVLRHVQCAKKGGRWFTTRAYTTHVMVQRYE